MKISLIIFVCNCIKIINVFWKISNSWVSNYIWMNLIICFSNRIEIIIRFRFFIIWKIFSWTWNLKSILFSVTFFNKTFSFWPSNSLSGLLGYFSWFQRLQGDFRCVNYMFMHKRLGIVIISSLFILYLCFNIFLYIFAYIK